MFTATRVLAKAKTNSFMPKMIWIYQVTTSHITVIGLAGALICCSTNKTTAAAAKAKPLVDAIVVIVFINIVV